MKEVLLLFAMVPALLFCQTHSIDNKNLHMTGVFSDHDISSNTYYNTIDSCNISWNIIKDSVPSQWEFSFCFPYCYIVGVTSGQDNFSPNEQLYLNCHIYPNGQAGDGIIQMEIITNSIHKDTITWNATVNSIAYLDEVNLLNDSYIDQIYDIFGRRVDVIQNSGVYIIEYNNNIRKKIHYIF